MTESDVIRDKEFTANKTMPFALGVFGRIWALWAVVLFISTMLIFFIPFLLFCYFQPDPLKTKRFTLYARIWMKFFLTLVGCPLQIKGKDHFQPGQTYIVLCNHNAFIDVPVSSPGIPGGNKTIAKIEMSKIPLFGMLYKTGGVLVDRKSSASRGDSFRKMKDVLNAGLHMCIYPEGTRNKTDQPLKNFHDGAFRLALDTQKPIIPAIIFNSRKAMPPGKLFFLLPYRLALHFLAPVFSTEFDTVETLKAKIFEIMKHHYMEGIHIRSKAGIQ